MSRFRTGTNAKEAHYDHRFVLALSSTRQSYKHNSLIYKQKQRVLLSCYHAIPAFFLLDSHAPLPQVSRERCEMIEFR